MKKLNCISIFYVTGIVWTLLHLLPKTGVLQSLWPFSLTVYSGPVLMLPGILLVTIAIILPSKYFLSLDLKLLSVKNYYLIFFGISTIALIVLSKYSVRHNFFGDGNLIEALTSPNLDIHFNIGYQNIKKLISLVSTYTTWSTKITFRIFSITGGILYFLGIFILIKDLKNNFAGLITTFIFATQPFILFFSNYIETYPLLAGFSFLYLSFSVKHDNSPKNNLILTVLILILIFLHPAFGIFIPGHIARYFFFTSKKRLVIPVLGIISLAAIFSYLFFAASKSGIIFNGYFLPVFQNSDQVYTVFSHEHIIDLLNYYIFLFLPISLLFILLKKNDYSFSNRHNFLLPYIFPVIVFLFLADFKLGAFDWDVFATILLPIIIYPLLATIDSTNVRVSRLKYLMFILGLSIAQLIPWLNINNSPEKAADFAIHTLKYDSHQQIGTRIYSLSTRLRNAGLKQKALGLSQKLDNKDGETNVVARNNFASSLIENGKYQEALSILQEITRRYPGYFHGNANLGELYIQHFNQPDSAYKYLSKAISQRPDASHVLYALAFIDMRAGRILQAKDKFGEVITIDPLHADAHAKLGMICLQAGERDRGIELFDRAIDLGGIPMQTQEMICNSFLQLGFPDKAKRCFHMIQKSDKIK